MNQIEDFFLALNTSWILSKFIPYFLIFLISIFLLKKLKSINFQKPLIKKFIGLLIVILPITFYLLFNPIYIGDITNKGIKVKSKIIFSKEKKLIILVLPECPYCHESIAISKKLIERNPKLKIEYWVTGDVIDSKFDKLKSDRISILQNREIEKTIYLTEGVFPTYLITKNKQIVKRWTNNEFGVLALDEIEFFLSN